MQSLLLTTLAGIALVVNIAFSAEPDTKGEVSLSINADREQPAGWPIIIDVAVTNTGKDPVSWWCCGPDLYPGAEHFLVEVRCGTDATWRKVAATNGQYVQGSSIDQHRGSGEVIVVPLALPVDCGGSREQLSLFDEHVEGVQIRVSPTDWRIAAPAEAYVTIRNRQEYVDRRRIRAITAITQGDSPFWQHVAEHYPDEVVLDAASKLVTVDCASIVCRAAEVLSHQPTLPQRMGDDLALTVRQWIPREPEIVNSQ